MNRRAAALRRAQGGYEAATNRPRQRRSTADSLSRAGARARLHGVEVRADVTGEGADTTAGLNFRGYASVTETAYDMWDMFGPYSETIASGAFGQTLGADPDVAFLLNHGGMTLARTTSGTLRLSEDDVGLLVDADLDPQNSDVRNMASGLDRGDLTELSFAFRIIRGTWDPSYTAYRIEQVDLNRGDVSVVNYGANPDTYVIPGADADPSGLDVDQLDDDQALALTSALERRAVRAQRSRNPLLPSMSRDELAALAALAAPHPLASRSELNRTH